MFFKYRIERLKKKVHIQKAVVEKIEVVEKQYGSSYYTDLMLKEHCKWLELDSKLRVLMRKADT